MALTWRMEVIEYDGGEPADGGKEVTRQVGHLPTPADARSARDWPGDSRASTEADTWVVRVRGLDGSLGTARGTRGGPEQRLSLTPAFTFAEQLAALEPIVVLLGRLRDRLSPEDPTLPAVSRLIPQLADLAVAVDQALRDTSHGRFSETAHNAQRLQRLSDQITATAADVAAYG